MKNLYDQLIELAHTLGSMGGHRETDINNLADPKGYIERLRDGNPVHENYRPSEHFENLVIRDCDLTEGQVHRISRAYYEAYYTAEDRKLLEQAEQIERPADWYDVEARKIVREATYLEKWYIMGGDRTIRLETGERVKLVYREND